MDQNVKIVLILGTARKGRKSEHVADLVKDRLEAKHVNFSFIDSRTSHAQPRVVDEAFHKAAAEADGFLVVTPEYNHSYPGDLKNLMDSEFEAYKHKPVVSITISKGQYGGVRALEHLAALYKTFGMLSPKADVNVAHVEDLVDNDRLGELQPRIDASINTLLLYAKKLKELRSELV